MSELLVSARLKVDRAKKHLSDLQAEITGFHARNPYCIICDAESKPGHELYRFEFVEHIPIPWGAIIGDIVHNLRAALDNAATALAVANGRTSRDVISNTYFPISATKEGFQKRLPADLRGASPAARRIVERMKPYQGGNDAFWRLHRLDNIDKHQAIVPVGVSYTKVAMKFPFAAMFEAMGESGDDIPDVAPLEFAPSKRHYPLKDGDIIMTYGVGPDPLGKHKPDFQFSFDIGFGEGQVVDGEPVIPTLQQLIVFTERVIKILARHAFR